MALFQLVFLRMGQVLAVVLAVLFVRFHLLFCSQSLTTPTTATTLQKFFFTSSVGDAAVWTTQIFSFWFGPGPLAPHSTEDTAFPLSTYDVDPSPCHPNGIHLSQASDIIVDPEIEGDGTRGTVNITVSFFLDFHQCAHARPFVLFGQGSKLEGVVPAPAPLQFNYTSGKSDGIFQSDFIYHVLLSNLQGGTKKHWYKILVKVDASLSGQPRLLRSTTVQTKRKSFLTPPLPGEPTTLALIGDLGQTKDSTVTMEHIWRASQTNHKQLLPAPATQLLIAGDISYADSDPNRWLSWFRIMQPLLHSILLHVAAGNHEIECNTDNLDIFVPYEHYFRVPNRLGGADMQPISDEYRKSLHHRSCSTPSVFQGHYWYGNSFYSYNHGLARIIVLNSYTHTHPDSPQYLFLEQQLIQANRERAETPWLLVAFHAPLYTTFLGHVNELEAIRMRVAMEPLFLEHKVNIIISGHDHSYMRTYPMFNGTVAPWGRAPIYLTLGAGGNREGHSDGYRHKDPEPWVAVRDNTNFGYGHLFVPNATHAKLTWVRDKTGEGGMEVHDSVWIENQCSEFSAVYRY